MLQPEHRRVVAVLILGVFLPLLDLTIVHPALNHFGVVFSVSISECQWVATGYALASATAIPVCGWASNRFGGKTLWLIGQVIFLIGSVGSAAVWDIRSLIAFRVLQGLGGGMLMPVMQTVLVQNVGQENAKRAMATMAIPSVLAPILGPVMGGVLLYWVGWRWLFLVNIPACVVAVAAAWRYLPNDRGAARERLDVRGLLLLSPGLALLVFGVSRLGESASCIDAGTLVPLVGGAALVSVFVFHATRSAAPLIDLTLFLNGNFRRSAGLLLFSSIAFFGGLVILPLFFQQFGGFGPVRVGLLLAAQGLGALVSRSFLAAMSERWGDRRVAVWAVMSAAGASAIFFVHPSEVPTSVLTVALVVRGGGLGVVTIMALSNAYAGLERAQVAHASTLTRIVTQFGASLGTAGLCAALQYMRGVAPADPGKAFGWTMFWLLLLTLASIWPITLMDGKGCSEQRVTRQASKEINKT